MRSTLSYSFFLTSVGKVPGRGLFLGAKVTEGCEPPKGDRCSKTSKALPSARQRVPKAALRVADATPLMGVGNRLRNRGRASNRSAHPWSDVAYYKDPSPVS